MQAEQKYIRTSPRKIRQVADGIRHLTPVVALKQLEFMSERASKPLLRVIKQAVANAAQNHKIDASNLLFDHILVDEGPTYKRWRAVSRGRAHSIFKRTSHIKVVLTTVKPKLDSVATLKTATTTKTKVKSIKS